MKLTLRIILLSAAAGLLSLASHSQNQTMTQEQMEMLQKMSPDQIKKLKEQTIQYEKESLDNKGGIKGEKSSQQGTTQKPATGQGARQLSKSAPYTIKKVATGEVDPMGKMLYREDTTMFSIEQLDDYIRLQKVDTMNVFGRDIFWQKDIVFAPSLNIPTPANYKLAVGDELYIDLWGTAEANYSLSVSPDGHINIPNVGIIPLKDLTIAQAEQRIRNRLVESVAGLEDGSVFIKVSLGNVRSIRVNVIGEARNPGTYTLPSLATLFNGLYAAGGVSTIGSLRDVRLYRGGKEIAALDVYDYLIDQRQDVNVRLEDNDMIVIKPYINIVKIAGSTKRPMNYEMRQGETMKDLIRYAGGFTGDAYTKSLTLSRKAGGRQYQIFTIEDDEFTDFTLQDGDFVEVGGVTKEYSNRVNISGAVWREGNYEISPRISRISELLSAAEGPKDDAFMGRAQIIRTRPDKTREIVSVNLLDIMNNGTGDIELQKNDSLYVASIYDLNEVPIVTIKGEVNMNTAILYADNMTISDLIIRAKGLKESASYARVEVSRRIRNPNSTTVSDSKSQTFTFSISGDLSLDPAYADFLLAPFDEVYIRRSPGYSEQKEVTIEGEVLFGGFYTLKTSTDRLSVLVENAGGFTPEAYVKGAYLQRKITESDMTRFESLRKIIESTQTRVDTTTLGSNAFEVGSYYSVGIDLEAAMKNPGGSHDIVVSPGDRLVIPPVTNTVKINGAVYYPNTVTYIPGRRLRDYIDFGGGYVRRAYRRPFVIYMNGLVAATKRGGKSPAIEPGCEIVVPMKSEKVGGSVLPQILTATTSLTSMAAIIAAMVK